MKEKWERREPLEEKEEVSLQLSFSENLLGA